MSLAREALRICTVRALRGATWVGDNVRDSEHGPFEDRAAEELRPTIVVYTDDGKFGEGSQHKALFAGGEINLVIEIAITQRMKVRVVTNEGTEEEQEVWDSPQTDAAMELTLGMIERQVKAALVHPQNAWAAMWGSFALSIGGCTSQRGSSMREGVRFAGRQLVIPVTLPSDPAPGVATLGPLWTKFLALVDATEELAPAAAMLRAMIEGAPTEWPGWERLRFAYGLNADEAQALGLVPPPGTADAEPTFAADGFAIAEDA